MCSPGWPRMCSNLTDGRRGVHVLRTCAVQSRGFDRRDTVRISRKKPLNCVIPDLWRGRARGRAVEPATRCSDRHLKYDR